MAENKDIGFKLEINGVEKSISSIKDLKGAIKDLQDVAENSDIGSEQYKQAIEDLEKLNDQLKEVTQTEKQAAKAAEDLAKAEKDAAKETGDLRKQFEVLEDELFMLAGQGKQNTERFRELTIEAAGLNKKIDEVNQSLSGGGAERAEAGFSKFGESLKKLDFKGVAQGAKLMGTALAATGVMLLVQGVTYLIENFDELSKGSGVLAKALRFVGDIIGQVVDTAMKMATAVTDLIGLTSQAERDMEAMGKAAIDAFTKSKEALAEQTAEMDRNIKVAKAMGKNTVEMEIEKQKAIIETNKQFLVGLELKLRERAATEEERKLIKESAKAIKDAKAEITVIEANAQKEKDATTKTNNATAEANRQKQLADEKKLFSDIQRERLASMADRDKAAYMQLELDKQKAIEEIDATKASEAVKQQARYSAYQEYVLKVEALDKQIADKKLAEEEKAKAEAEAKRLKEIEDEKKLQDELLAISKAKILKEIEDEKKKQAEIFELTNTSLSATQNLSDLFFTLKSQNLKKGSKEEEENAKKQFEINKALQIATAVVNGAQGVLAITTVPDFTLGVATAIRIAGQVALTAATVAKIATTKFSSSSSGGGAATGGGAPNVPIPPPPTVSNANANIEGSKFDEQGNKISNGSTTPAIQVNATVGVDEISAKTNRVNVLEKQSTF
jgi:hypothetical protein